MAESQVVFLGICRRPPPRLPAGWQLEHEAEDRVLVYPATAWVDPRWIVQFSGALFEPSPDRERLSVCLGELYDRHGPALLSQIEGAGELIVYDRLRQQVFGGTDRFRVGRLFYHQGPGLLALANRFAPLFALGAPRKPNPRMHVLFVGANYRRFRDLRHETFFSGVSELPFAGRLVAHGGRVTVNQYWDLALRDCSQVPPAQMGEHFMGLLRDSVRRRLANCSRPAFTISSGMDSSSVVCLASELLGRQVPLYTTTYPEQTEYNEADDIAIMARRFGSSWRQVLVTGDAIPAALQDCLRQGEEPYATVTQLMHYFVARQAREDGHDALFSGLGGDEANSGEIEEYLFFFADLHARGLLDELREHMVGWQRYHDHPLYPKNEQVLQRFFDRQIDFSRPGHNRHNPAYHQPYGHVFRPEAIAGLAPSPRLDHPYSSYLRNKLYQDLFSETIPPVLQAESANSAIHGLPTFYPYLDPAVMQCGFSIPLALKYERGMSKALLRRALRGRLPDAVVDNGTKRGWNAPFNQWLSRFIRPVVESLLDHPTDRQREWYELGTVRRLLDEHLASQANHMMFFWQFLNYEQWYERHFG